MPSRSFRPGLGCRFFAPQRTHHRFRDLQIPSTQCHGLHTWTSSESAKIQTRQQSLQKQPRRPALPHHPVMLTEHIPDSLQDAKWSDNLHAHSADNRLEFAIDSDTSQRLPTKLLANVAGHLVCIWTQDTLASVNRRQLHNFRLA